MSKRSIRRLIFTIACCFSLTILFSQQNSLTAAEKKESWRLLFNGNDLQGWHSYSESKPGKAWQVTDGTIALVKDKKSVSADYADLTSNDEFGDFDLKFEWKISPCTNSGVMFYVHESPEYKDSWATGPEMQIEDLVCSPDHLSKMNRAGSLYDLVAVDSEWVNNADKWYEFEIKINKGHAEFFEDGHKVIDTHMWDDHWKELIANCKFKDMPNFGTFRKGHIAFQGTEEGKLWLRNIKIRTL